MQVCPCMPCTAARDIVIDENDIPISIDVLNLIFNKLPTQHLQIASVVCKKWRQIISKRIKNQKATCFGIFYANFTKSDHCILLDTKGELAKFDKRAKYATTKLIDFIGPITISRTLCFYKLSSSYLIDHKEFIRNNFNRDELIIHISSIKFEFGPSKFEKMYKESIQFGNIKKMKNTFVHFISDGGLCDQLADHGVIFREIIENTIGISQVHFYNVAIDADVAESRVLNFFQHSRYDHVPIAGQPNRAILYYH